MCYLNVSNCEFIMCSHAIEKQHGLYSRQTVRKLIGDMAKKVSG